jgi:tRNA threonylcarbamoyladenosine biosynthesis protein TsaE
MKLNNSFSKTFSYSELPEIISLLRSNFKQNRVFLFFGDLGAGKTTIVRTLLESCGVTDPITSPTFTYVNQYRSTLDGTKYIHFDLYRLANLEQFYALGLDEFLSDQEAFIFIEWPELVQKLLQKNACLITLAHGKSEDQRTIKIELSNAAS